MNCFQRRGYLTAVKAGHENDPWVKPLVEAYENDTVRATLAKVYKGTALPAW